MGGILTKMMITRLPTLLRQKITHFITVGTPHLGIPSIALNQLGVLLGNKQLNDLNSHNKTIRELNFKWDKIRDSIPHTFLFGIHDDVVPRKYAVPRDDEFNCIPVNADHSSICRPVDQFSEIVRKVSALLLNSLSSIVWERLDYETFERILNEYAANEGLESHKVSRLPRQNTQSDSFSATYASNHRPSSAYIASD